MQYTEDDAKLLHDKIKMIQELENENEELENEIVILTHKLGAVIGSRQRTFGRRIDCGIGELGISCSGSIDIVELIEELELCIKSNGIKDTIRILAMAK
jgi:hypothetical protein